MATRSTLAALLGACALAAASDAWAQTTTVDLEFVADSPKVAGQDDCLNKTKPFSVRWSFPNGTPTTATKLLVYVTAGSACQDDAPTDSFVLFSETTVTGSTASGTRSFGPADFVDASCPLDITKNALVCAKAKQQETTSTSSTFKVVSSDELTVTYDSKIPNKPVINEVVGGDNALNVSWQGADDVDQWLVVLRKVEPILPDTGEGDSCTVTLADAGAPADGGAVVGEPRQESFGGDQTGGRVDGLVNGQVYEVTVQAVDAANNASPLSDPLRGAPVKVDDFFARYVCAGGEERGGYGCSSAGWALLPLASLALLPLLRRRAAGGRS